MASTAAVLNILVNAQTGTAQAQLSLLDKRLKSTAATAEGTSGILGGKFKKGLAAGAVGFAAVGVAAVAAGKELYNVGKELDSAYDKIRAGTGKTGKQLEQLKRDFRAVAGSVPDDLATTGTAIADLNRRLGLAGKPLRVLSREMLNLSRITETDLEGNIKSVARAFVDWEVPVRRQGKALDGLYRLSERSGAAVAEIADNIQKFGSPLRTLGFGVDEAAAMFANFERAGVNVQTMVPGLKLAIGNLADPTDDLRSTLEGLGVATESPRRGLRDVMDLLANNSSLSAIDKMNLAMDVFGKRAGADMAEAVKQGRFNLGSFVDTFRKGSDTINKSARDTNDAGENMAIFWNNVKLAVAPAADAVYEGVSKFSKVLAGLPLRQAVGDVRRFFKSNQDLKDVLRAARVALKIFGVAASVVWNSVKETFRGLVQYLKGSFEVLRGIVRVFSRLLRGDFKGAWDAVKEIFRGSTQVVIGVMRAMTAPIRAVTARVASALKGVFSSAWGKVRDIFSDGADAVMSIVRSIVDVLNRIPGVNIDLGSTKVGDEGSAGTRVPGGHATHRQRGGMLFGGKPSGDSIPAMLERGEYVLNRNAAAKVGRKQLDKLNFGTASRFQTGGPVGMLGGGIADAVSGAASSVAGAASGLAGKALSAGPSWFIKQLPKPNLPQPFSGTGPWLIEQVTDWIKDKVKISLGSGSAAGAGTLHSFPMLSGDTDFAIELGNRLSKMAKATGTPISVSSGWRSYAEQAALYQAYLNGTGNLAAPPGSSNHEDGRAADISPGSEFFGGVAGKFGLGFTVPGESWHIEMLRRGGLVGMIKGGLVKHPWFDESTKKGNINGVWPSADLAKNPSGWYALPTLPGYVIGALAEAAGRHFGIPVPGRTMMQMVMGEGAAKPGSQGTDPGGATKGYGLWAVTTSFNDSLVKRFGGSYGAMNNPVLNAAAMAHIWKEQGTGAWFGDQYVTDSNAHWRGAYHLTNALGGLSYSSALRSALTGKPVDTGDGMSDKELAKRASQRRLENRQDQLKKLLRAARGSDSAQGKKGAYWQILDLFAKYGDFGFRPGRSTVNGGFAPGNNQAADFLLRASRIAGLRDPNRGAGQLYSLVGWLRDHVDLTGDADGNDRLAGKLADVREAGAARASSKRARKFARMQRFAETFPWGKPLNRNERQIIRLQEMIGLAEREHSGEWSPGGSDYTDAERNNEIGLNRRLMTRQNREYRMLRAAIPWVEDRIAGFQKVVDAAKDDPQKKWLLPGYRKQLAAAKNLLSGGAPGNTGLKQALVNLIGVTGDAGTRGETYFRLKELGVISTVEKQAASGVSIGDLRQIVDFAALGGYKNMPVMHTGGIVPGVGDVPIVAQGGEGVFTRDQMAAMGAGNITIQVNFKDDRLKDLIDFQIVENDRGSNQFVKAAGV